MKKLGQVALELLDKIPTPQGAIDTQREMQKGYMDAVIACAKRYTWKEPFYVCVQNRKEQLIPNVIRNQFYGRMTRPSPNYDLTLFSYDPSSEKLSFEWSVPDAATCKYMIDNESEIPDEQLELLNTVKKFKAGVLV